jgi:hypothetical protein
MTSVREMRVALAEAYSGLGFRTYDVLPDDAELPFAAVSWPDRIIYNETLDGGVRVDIVVSVGVSLNDMEAAQQAIDDVMDPGNIPAKVPLHTTTAWYDCVVSEASNIRQVNVGAQALVVDFIHEIHAY